MTFHVILGSAAISDLRRLGAYDRKSVRVVIERVLTSTPVQLSRSRTKRLRELDSPEYRVMKLKAISVEQLAMETGKVVNEACKRPVVVRAAGKPPMILRPLLDDDAADELLLGSSAFRASIRAARREHAAGKGMSLAEARRRLNA